MTELDLGGLFATADILTTPFDRKFPMLVAKFASLSESADKFAASAAQVDRALASNAAAADKAATSSKRSTDTTLRAAAADDKAAAASRVRSEALTRVNAILASVAGETTRVQQATLRDYAAQERLGAAYTETGSQAARLAAETARVAAAQAGAIGTSERLAAAQRAEAAAAGEATVAGGRLRTGLVGIGRTAGQLGLLVGGIELVKKALDISHEATQFQAAITRIQTQAGAASGELAGFSQSLLKMAPDVAQAPEDLATSLYHVYSATKALGYTGPQMLKAVDVAAKGATVSGADLEETTNALTATMVSGLGSVNDMGKAMGALNAIVGAGDMKLSDLNSALGTGILAVAKVFGVTLSQAGAALAVFGDNNIRGAKAATTLRMVIQDLTKPAATADETLGKIGLTVTSLRDDLEKGGLSLALTHLKKNLDQAGVTGNKVGGFIEDAFTKKAGVGLAMLLNNLDQYDAKQAQIATGARNFGSEWSATTKTARYALDRLWTSIEAGGIAIASKLSPAVAKAAMWLGTAVPHALSVLAQALGPTVRLVGTALVSAWHGLLAVLRPVVTVLGNVGHFLASHTDIVTTFGTAVLGMWAAFKLASIATNALRGIREGMAALAATARTTSVAVETSMTVANIAIAGVGVVLTTGALLWERHANAVAAAKAQVKAYTDAITQDNGAIGENTRLLTANTLQQNGVYDAARKLGVSLGTVTDAALGNKPALDRLNTAYDAYQKRLAAVTKEADNGTGAQQALAEVALEGGKALSRQGDAWDKVRSAVDGTNTTVKEAIQSYKNVKAGAKGVIGTSQQLATVTDRTGEALRSTYNSQVPQNMDKIAGAAGDMSHAMDRAWLSGKKLAAALQGLTGRTDMAQAFIQMKQGLYGLKDAWDKTSNSISANTKAGADNRSALVGQIQNIQSYAATLDHGKNAAKNMSAAMISGLAELRTHAISDLGVSKAQWHDLINTMHLTPHDITTHLHTDTYNAMRGIQVVQQAIRNIDGTIYLHTSYRGGGQQTHGASLGLAGGGTVHGPGTPKSDSVPIMASKGEEVIQEPYASRYRSILKAINVGRYANGGTVTTKQVGGKTVYMVGGHEYSTRQAAQNAIHSASASTAETRASGALTNIRLDSSSFSFTRFQQQIQSATALIAAAVKAGISHSQYVALQQRLHRDERRGEALERKLGRSIHGAANKLGGSLADLNNPASVGDVRGQLHTLEGLLRQAGLPKQFINGLDQENRHILALVKVRDQAARGLAKANSAMASARAHEMNDYRSFSAASRGAFDITNPVASGKKITAGSLRAGQAQALTRVRQWVSGITKLAGKHIFPASYLRQLAGGGPTAENLATVQALLSMSGAGLRDFAHQERQIAALSGQEGRVVAGRLDSHQLRVADRRVQRAQEREDVRQARLEHAIDTFGHRIVHELQHQHLEAKIKGGDLVVILRHGQRDAKAHHRTGRNLVGS